MRFGTVAGFACRLSLLVALAAAAVVVALLLPPIAQDPAYHRFADQRARWGVPHFADVLSNVAFVLVGIYGLMAWRRARWAAAGDRWPWLVAAVASIGIGLGSGYYHWEPNSRTLFWDRLPMTIAFMSVFASAIIERIHRKAGLLLFLPFLLLGILSVEVWRRGELTGVGDLRFYALVQFYPMIALPLMFVLFPSRYTRTGDLWAMLGLYGAAKLLELFDMRLFDALGRTVSGHTLKHVAAALALGLALRSLRYRGPAD